MAAPYLAQDHQQLAWIGGSRMEVLLDAERSDGQLMVTRSSLVRGDSAPVHVHGREDELFVVLAGEVTFWVGEQRQQVTDGGLAWLPRGLAHTYRVDSEQAQLMTVCTPGGLEGFFRTAGRDLALPEPDGWAITPQTMGAALAAHGGSIVGPPKGPTD